MIGFVALGPIPPWTRDALAQARRANPGMTIALLHEPPAGEWREFARRHAIELYDLTTLRRDARFREFYDRPDDRCQFRSGFWQHTSGRLFAVRAFMEREGLEALTHLENDVLLYAPLASFDRWAPFTGPTLATVFENARRAIPGMVRIGSRQALDRFTDMVLSEPAGQTPDDMHRLAALRTADPAAVVDLPTLPPSPDAGGAVTSSLFRSCDVPMPPGRWLFDGARFGQYLGGIDPRNQPSSLARWLRWQRGTLPRPNGFINESCTDDPSRYSYTVSRRGELAVPTLSYGREAFPLATLHVHSKKLYRFTSLALERHLRR